MSTAYTRREFVTHGLGLVGLGLTAPSFLTKTAWSMTSPWSTFRETDGRILVVVQLAGGNDGLNTVVPYGNDGYLKARPGLALKTNDVLKLDDEYGLPKEAEGLKELYDAGKLAVLHGVGYPNPNRSHFVSTDIWATADPEQATYTGWMGRYLEKCCDGSSGIDPKTGIALGNEVPLAMIGSNFNPVSFQSPSELAWLPHESNPGGEKIFEILNGSGEPRTGVGESSGPLRAVDFLKKAALDARVSADQIRKAAGQGGERRRKRSPLNFRFNSSLEQQLTMVARMIEAGLPTKVYYVQLGGFDTHSGQRGRHANLMKQLGDSLRTFQKQLSENRLEERVLLMTFSEFGRRVAQNASGGTDHGTAAPLFILGSAVRGGLIGKHPSLSNLDNGDLRFTEDFRSVYSTVLEDWLGTDTKAILGGSHGKIKKLIRES